MSGASPTRILILGGGFAALSAARELEKALPADESVHVTLVSKENFLLYTPLLAEAATGQIPPEHIATPLRTFLRRVHVRKAEVASIDRAARQVTVQQPVTGEVATLPYDHLVMALGAITGYHHVPGAAEHSLAFKTLWDAARVRAHVVSCFEQASEEPDEKARRALLTFVVAGGGFSGVELAASLVDFLRTLRRYYPVLAGEPLRLVVAHHGKRLLEELNERAAAYTLGLLQRRGIAVRLGTGVSAVAVDSVELSPGGTIPTRSVFWTAGVAPDPMIATLGVPLDQHGAIIVDEHLAVPGFPGLWALGDCAHVPDPRGTTYAPTAQNAEREGPLVAHNLLATIQGRPLRPFEYRTMGMMASLGRQRAVGEVFGHTFSGLSAWFMWRMVYLAKLPGWDRRTRVGLDWTLDFVLPPDILSPSGIPSDLMATLRAVREGLPMPAAASPPPTAAPAPPTPKAAEDSSTASTPPASGAPPAASPSGGSATATPSTSGTPTTAPKVPDAPAAPATSSPPLTTTPGAGSVASAAPSSGTSPNPTPAAASPAPTPPSSESSATRPSAPTAGTPAEDNANPDAPLDGPPPAAG